MTSPAQAAPPRPRQRAGRASGWALNSRGGLFAIATALSRALSYGTIYTTKLLRRGTDIDHSATADPLQDLTVADAMSPFQPQLAVALSPGPAPGPGPAALPGPATSRHTPQVLLASESLAQALRQLELYGRDGLPVISADGQRLQGWITCQNVLHAVAQRISAAQEQLAADSARPGAHASPGYPVLEVSITAGSPAAGRALGDISWPPDSMPVSVLDHRTLRDPEPGITRAEGDRVNLLARTPGPQPPPGVPAGRVDGASGAAAGQETHAPA